MAIVCCLLFRFAHLNHVLKKGANVLVTGNGVAKLADFGCARQIHQVITSATTVHADDAQQASDATGSTNVSASGGFAWTETSMGEEVPEAVFEEELLKTVQGSVPWMAPEVMKQTGHGKAVDIWYVFRRCTVLHVCFVFVLLFVQSSFLTCFGFVSCVSPGASDAPLSKWLQPPVRGQSFQIIYRLCIILRRAMLHRRIRLL